MTDVPDPARPPAAPGAAASSGAAATPGAAVTPDVPATPDDTATPLVAVRHRARNLTRATELVTSLEVAGSLWGKFMGLMGRPSLAAGAGLWLPESNGIHMMFMRFPIDAVFVGKVAPDRTDGARPVLAVHRDLRAWTGLVPLVRGAHGVLELPVGTITPRHVQVGPTR